MAVHVFGAIDIGSYTLELKVFEVSKKNGIRQIDDVMHRVDLGTDTYNTGKISAGHMAQVRKVLKDFAAIMKNYRVEEYRAYGTSAFREMVNSSIVLRQLEQETGIHIDLLTNSEQRFMDYKSVAFKGADFNRMLEKGTAIIDLGGGSIQISLFEENRLYATQNLKLGILRLYDQVRKIGPASDRLENVIEELVNSQLKIFQKLYLKGRTISNVIVVDDYISAVAERNNIHDMFSPGEVVPEAQSPEFIDVSSFKKLKERLFTSNHPETAAKLHVSEENIPLIEISTAIVDCATKLMNAELIWVPGVTLCDGIVYEYAEEKRLITIGHDFEQDIIACAKEISKRYKGSEERSNTIATIALKIFDSTKRIHGMGHRERLLLQIAAILHDCGKYVSIVDMAKCSYDIIMSTEIIGISHIEREIIANIVKFNHTEFVYYEAQSEASDLSLDDYITLTRLTAILRLANGLDRSHKKKFTDIKTRIHDDEFIITVTAKKDISVEKGLFGARADFFEEVFNLRPVIRQRG